MSLTLTAEPAVIDGARSYAEHSGMTSSSNFESQRSRALSRVSDENAPQWLNDISGIVSLPSGKSDDDLVCEAIAEKYGEVR